MYLLIWTALAYFPSFLFCFFPPSKIRAQQASTHIRPNLYPSPASHPPSRSTTLLLECLIRTYFPSCSFSSDVSPPQHLNLPPGKRRGPTNSLPITSFPSILQLRQKYGMNPPAPALYFSEKIWKGNLEHALTSRGSGLLPNRPGPCSRHRPQPLPVGADRPTVRCAGSRIRRKVGRRVRGHNSW